ncbi:MAG: hypothetical protein ACRDRR_16480, partial [Pseudonocardiaceae bacterium]
MSSVANDALREAHEVAAHRAALREWLDELDEKYGTPSAEELAAAQDLLDAVQHGERAAAARDSPACAEFDTRAARAASDSPGVEL